MPEKTIPILKLKLSLIYIFIGFDNDIPVMATCQAGSVPVIPGRLAGGSDRIGENTRFLSFFGTKLKKAVLAQPVCHSELPTGHWLLPAISTVLSCRRPMTSVRKFIRLPI